MLTLPRQEQYRKPTEVCTEWLNRYAPQSIGHTSALTIVDAQAVAPHHSSAKEIYFIVKVPPDALGALASTAPWREEMCGQDANCASGNFAFPRRVHDPERRTRNTSASSTEQAGCSFSM